MSKAFLEYRTYEQLLSEIQSDFKSLYLRDYINPQEFIKVAKRCNYELGLKIFKTKEIVLDVEKGKAKLPNNFNVLNFAFVLGSHTATEPLISGTHVENVSVGPTYNPGNWDTVDLCAPENSTPIPVAKPCGGCGLKFNNCNCKPVGDVQLNCKGKFMVLVQNFKFHTRRWTDLYAVRIINSPDVVDADCPNRTMQAKQSAYIKNGFIYPSFQTGKIYINYQGQLEDDEGNLLVPDHDLLNEFYEYAIKQRVFENMVMNGDLVKPEQLQIIEQRLKAARNNAYSLVNTPDFGELRRIWEVNRKAQYHNYFNMFSSHGYYN
tara:strand:- start:951 stop:1910 length:960 start_codon:yes stop_codon:yes gene_type:complete